MKSFTMGVIGMAVLAAVSISSPAQAQEIKVAGSAAPAEIFEKSQVPFEKASGLKLTVTTKGAIGMLKDLDAGAVEMAAIGLTFSDWMDLATKEGYKIPDRNAYKSRVIGKDLVKVAVNKANPVKQLSKEQLKGIFSGKIANWKEVGGKDQSIILVRSTAMPGPLAVFQRQVMEGEAYSKTFKDVLTHDDVVNEVGKGPGAIGLVTAMGSGGSVAMPAIPEVGRPITAITKGAPSANVVKLFDFIRGEGQKYLAK
jgi:phosphate transport system substrate-binding protein